MRITAFLASLLAGLGSLPVQAAEASTVKFTASTQQFMSPERGFWRFVADDFAKASDESIAALYDDGLTLGYAIVLLDAYRQSELPAVFLAKLESRFAATRKAGIKIVLRFAYNYPSNSSEYEDAKDAPLPVLLKHIEQLTPVLRKNADVIAALQAGFIGAWGEGHTSSNGLDSAKNKAVIRDALLAAVPETIPLQWRYPADLIEWQQSNQLGRFGFHNDCFLSSKTDVGTYADEPEIRQNMRAHMARLTASSFHSVETCDAQKAEIRKDCKAIMEEGPQFHVSAINRDYYRAFHAAWEKGGCMAEITAKMGYRLRLVDAALLNGNFTVTIANDGWARPSQPRHLELRYGEKVLMFTAQTLDQIAPGTQVILTAQIGSETNGEFCLAAPDQNPTLKSDARYALRFANADTGEGIAAQKWRDGAFCFSLK